MKTTLLSALFFTLLFTPLFSQTSADGNRAFKHVDYLAADSFKGRRSGTPEYLKAAEYVAARMKEYGLAPGGDNGTYLQSVPFKNWRVFAPPARLITLTPRRREYFPGRSRDFSPLNGTGSGTVKGQLVFAGYGIESDKHEWNDFSNLDLEGKIALIIPGAPEKMKKEAVKIASIDKKIKTLIKKGAIGVIEMDISPPGSQQRRRRRTAIKKGTCPEGFVAVRAGRNFLDDAFYMDNRSWKFLVSQTIRGQKSFTADLDVEVEIEAHYSEEKRSAPNVIGILPGTDPELKEECIVLGGHLDHLGVSLDGFVYNGADDNAASAAVILEVARIFQANRFLPKRTIVFASWAGEEMGLIGSRYYTNNPVIPLKKTVLYMNIDMVGSGDDDFYVGGMWEFADFFAIIRKKLGKEMLGRLKFRRNYRGSDHSAFIAKGVTAFSLRTGNVLTRELDDEHPEYHYPGDTIETIDPDLLKLAAEYHINILTNLADSSENLLDPKHSLNFLHKDATVVDLHCDTISRYMSGTDLSENNLEGHIDIPKLKQGAVDLQVFAAYVGPPSDEKQKMQAAKRALQQIDALHRLVEENGEDLALIKTYADIGATRRSNKVGVLIGIEGGYAIENDLSVLRSFYREGVRLMTLTHWTRTDWANASGDQEADLGGLTELGEEVVKEMNKLGMIIDLSHAHDETFWDVIRLSKDPVVASHSCCRALSDHFRNLSDDMLKALAKNGGMIGINYLPGFLNADRDAKFSALRLELLKKHGLPTDRRQLNLADPDKRKTFQAEYKVKAKALTRALPLVSVKTVVDHIEHVIEVTGNANHVGLGSDFDGISSTPVGLRHTGKLANITRELKKRGIKNTDIKKILGGNFLRIFRKITSD